MQNESNSSFLSTVEKGVDMFINIGAIYLAYIFAYLTFGEQIISLHSIKTAFLVFAVVLFEALALVSFKIYRSVPFGKVYKPLFRIAAANLLYFAIVLAFAFIFLDGAKQGFVTVWIGYSFAVSTSVLVLKKYLVIHISAVLRRKNYRVCRVIIVGDNAATIADFIKQAELNPQYGISVIGYVGDRDHGDVGCERLGELSALGEILDTHRPYKVVFAVDSYNKSRLISMVNLCDDRCIKVVFLPVIYGFFKSGRQISSVGTLPVINVHSTPLDNPFNAFIKRAVDIVGSFILIILTLPIMLFAAVGVKLSSPGPILFKQERVGKLGKPFTMLKFRSMRVNRASDNTWTTDYDPRKTRFGNFLRMTSIDELPQLFNVLAGSMSLVGPRPEIPHFVEYFKDIIPLYMVKHYVKPGLTGLAQVRGLRGDTSVEERILADIEYIENWSFLKDIGIILYTPFKAINKHERYDKNEQARGIDSTATQSDEELAEQIAAEGARTASKRKRNKSQKNEGGENSPKRILYAASTTDHIDSFHREYIDALTSEGYEVKVMARGEGADFNIPFEKKMLSRANTACRRRIRRILAEERFDAVILNTTLAAFHIRMAMPPRNRPRTVNIVHGYLFSRHSAFFKRRLLLSCERALARKTDTVIVMNSEDRNIAENHRLCRGEVRFIRGMGASIKPTVRSSAEIRRELGDYDKFVMAFVGELSKRKNQEFLIKSMVSIKKKIPDATLWLVGEGAEGDRHRALVSRLGLDGAVKFLGKRDNPADYMRACDLYVSASNIEGMPFNIIEALGCGATVLASRIKGHEDIISHGTNGYLYEPADQREFAASVLRIYLGGAEFSPDAPREAGMSYSRDAVFGDTFSAIKESLEK